MKKRKHLEDLDVDGMILLMKTGSVLDSFKRYRVQKHSPVNTVISLRFPQKARNNLTDWATVGFSMRTMIYGVSQSADRAVAQAVSSRPVNAVARVWYQVISWGFVVEKMALGQDFSEYFGFPCHSYSTHCSICMSTGAAATGPLAVAVPSGPQSHPTNYTYGL
jgi:hypothetical protein